MSHRDTADVHSEPEKLCPAISDYDVSKSVDLLDDGFVDILSSESAGVSLLYMFSCFVSLLFLSFLNILYCLLQVYTLAKETHQRFEKYRMEISSLSIAFGRDGKG